MQLINTLSAFENMISAYHAAGYATYTPVIDVRINGPYIELDYGSGNVARFGGIDEAVSYYKNILSLVIDGIDYEQVILDAYAADRQPAVQDPFVPVNGDIDDVPDLPVNGSGDMILIENLETGERRYIDPDDDIPAGWIVVYTADTGIATLFPWLIFGTLFFLMTVKR